MNSFSDFDFESNNEPELEKKDDTIPTENQQEALQAEN